MKKKLVVITVALSVMLVSIGLFTYKAPMYRYSSDVYSVKVDTAIRSLVVDGVDVCAKYQVFQCEENYHQLWKLETSGRFTTPVVKNELFTYSSLYTFDVLKKFTFFSDHFLVNISKCYTHSGFDENNQILVDIKNIGWAHDSTSFTFHLASGGEVTVRILWSNVPIEMQPPPGGTNPTELQFNFRNQSDETVAYHTVGTIETALFSVSIGR